MAEKLEIRRLRTLPAVLSPSTLYITRTVGNPKLIDVTMTGDTIAEVRKTMGVVETTELINTILETWVPKRALKSDISDRATLADAAVTADSAQTAVTATSAQTAATATTALSADRLKGPVKITITGDVSGSTTWLGTGDITIPTTGGGGGGGVISPQVFLEDNFNTEGPLSDRPFEVALVPGSKWGDDCIGVIDEAGLGPNLESRRGAAWFGIGDGANKDNFRPLKIELSTQFGSGIYEGSRGEILVDLFFLDMMNMKVQMSRDARSMVLLYGPQYGSSATLSLSTGTYNFTILRDIQGYSIEVMIMESDSPRYEKFHCFDPAPKGMAWGDGGFDFAEYLTIKRFAVTAL